MKKKVSEIGFEDSTIHSFKCEPDNSLYVEVQSWDQTKIVLKFTQLAGMEGHLSHIQDFIEETEFDEYAASMVKQAYLQLDGTSSVPSPHPYHFYKFVDPEGDICMRIVSESVELTRTKEYLYDNIIPSSV